MGRSPEFMRSIARRGGESTKAKYGTEHFKEVGAMGGRAGKHKRKPRKKPSVLVAPIVGAKPMLDSLDAILSELNA